VVLLHMPQHDANFHLNKLHSSDSVPKNQVVSITF
jgi:hypothetical protein